MANTTRSTKTSTSTKKAGAKKAPAKKAPGKAGTGTNSPVPLIYEFILFQFPVLSKSFVTFPLSLPAHLVGFAKRNVYAKRPNSDLRTVIRTENKREPLLTKERETNRWPDKKLANREDGAQGPHVFRWSGSSRPWQAVSRRLSLPPCGACRPSQCWGQTSNASETRPR